MLRQRQYGLARGAERTQAGEILISALLNAGRAEQESGRAEAASALYRRALGAAQAVKSSRAGLVRAMIDNLRVARQRDEKIARLKQQLKANPEDRAAGAELLRIHVVELDDPSAARRYTFLTDDEKWKTNVPLAARPVEELSAAQALELGEWYRGLAMSAPEMVRGAMYQRAQAYLSQFLEAPETAGGDRLKVNLYLRGIEAALAKLSETGGVTSAISRRQAGELVAIGSFQDGSSVTLPAQRRGFIAVAAHGSRWLALRSDGRVIGSETEGRYKVPDDLKKATGIGCGMWADIAVHRDGTLTMWGGLGQHESLMPKDVKDVKAISAGHGIYLALRRDGRVVAWENAASAIDPETSRDVVDIAAASSVAYVLKRDGRVIGRNANGALPGRPDGLPPIVQIASGMQSGCLMLARTGKVFQWGGTASKTPLPRGRQVRAGGGLYALQKMDRTWVIWGAAPKAKELNLTVQKMGPLKDLALSSGVHTFRGFVIGIR